MRLALSVSKLCDLDVYGVNIPPVVVKTSGLQLLFESEEPKLALYNFFSTLFSSLIAANEVSLAGSNRNYKKCCMFS